MLREVKLTAGIFLIPCVAFLLLGSVSSLSPSLPSHLHPHNSNNGKKKHTTLSNYVSFSVFPFFVHSTHIYITAIMV